MNRLRLLVITDVHYRPGGPQSAGPRRGELGLELLARAIEDATRRGGFDCLALLGDLLDDGRRQGAEEAAIELLATVESAGVPTIVLPGNHDYDGQHLPAGLPGRSRVLEIAGYRLVAFVDAWRDRDYGTRRHEDLQLLRDLADQPGGPIIALQHSPMHPPIDSEYPYMLTNRPEVMHQYAQAGVLLSISGHYHAGQPLNSTDGVLYLTVPAICEPPFRYALVSLHGREVDVEVRQLSADRPGLFDCHAHTEFAYCGEGISAEAAIQRSGAFGLAGVCLVEHAPQLYCTAEEFWAAMHIREPARWRKGQNSRMAEFRRAMEPHRAAGARVGLEVELDREGKLTLLDEDRQWIDLIVGALHWLPEDASSLTDAELARAFMRANELMLAAGVDVLAHPWRFFRWSQRDVPTELYRPLAELLRATDTAAEINFHSNTPDPAFFAACIERGVKIALGTDAHRPHEAGALSAHLALLRHIAATEDLAELLMPYPTRKPPADAVEIAGSD